jgi:hypothetical protein
LAGGLGASPGGCGIGILGEFGHQSGVSFGGVGPLAEAFVQLAGFQQRDTLPARGVVWVLQLVKRNEAAKKRPLQPRR